MERSINLLQLDRDQRERFDTLLSGFEQIYAPYGVRENGSALPPEDYESAVIILGNPPAEHLRRCTKLRLLQTSSAGVDRYTAPGVLPPGVTLAGCSGAWGPAIAEHMLAMLLALMKRLPSYRDRQREGTWERLGREKTLMQARVLVIGTGDLGASFAVRCKALGAYTAGIRRDPAKSAAGVDEMHSFADLDEQLALADVVALMLPHAPETAGLMDTRRLGLLKDDAILINGGRGTAVDWTPLPKRSDRDACGAPAWMSRVPSRCRPVTRSGGRSGPSSRLTPPAAFLRTQESGSPGSYWKTFDAGLPDRSFETGFHKTARPGRKNPRGEPESSPRGLLTRNDERREDGSHSWLRMILPELVLGSSDLNSTIRGYL